MRNSKSEDSFLCLSNCGLCLDEFDLVLFTWEFPYGKTAETFLETEIDYLASKYRKIAIIPSVSSKEDVRKLPDNVFLMPIFERYGLTKTLSTILRNLPKIFETYIYELKHTRRPIAYIKHISYVKMLLRSIVKYDILKYYILDKNTQTLFYDYWFVNSTVTLTLLKKEGIINKFISRAHGFDVYDDRVLPTPAFINFVIRYICNVFTVSIDGSNELKSKLDKQFSEKIKTAYLGTMIPKAINIKDKNSNVFNILSCSDVIEIKRIDRIIDVLSLLKTTVNVHWTHIGDGDLMGKILDLAKEKLGNVEFTIAGSMEYDEVIDYYNRNYVDLFINLSRSEGLPVSIMEATSYGIPVVSCNVGGIAEIVTPLTGVLFDVNENARNIALTIDKIINKEIVFDRFAIAMFCKDKFDADNNYLYFVDLISKLR